MSLVRAQMCDKKDEKNTTLQVVPFCKLQVKTDLMILRGNKE